MDGQRFDHVARLIGAGASRRGILKGLAASLLGVGGAGLVRLGADAQEAQGACILTGDACADDGDPCCGDSICVGVPRMCAGVDTCVGGDGPCNTETGPFCCGELVCYTSDGANGACGAAEEPTCAGIFGDCSELPCCGEALCAGDQFGNEICFRPDECPVEGDGCAKGFCCPGHACVEGICTATCSSVIGSECASNDDCCSDDGLICVDSVCTVEVCREETEECGVGMPCCDGFVCGDDNACATPVVEPECETDADCVVVAAGDVDAAICCAGVCRQIECCIDDILTGGNPNDRCDDGETCFEGLCIAVCVEDTDCAGSACCCEDGSCADACCPDAPVTLPNTGVADGDGGMSGLLTAGLAAGAAALLAGAKLRASEE